MCIIYITPHPEPILFSVFKIKLITGINILGRYNVDPVDHIVYNGDTAHLQGVVRVYGNIVKDPAHGFKTVYARLLFGLAVCIRQSYRKLFNAGVAALADNDLDKAEEFFGKAAGTKANLNAALGTLYTKKGDYAAAKKAYGETATNNAAVQQILDEDYAAAAKTLANIKEPNATTAYLKAIVGARTNDKAAVIENLKAAVAQDAQLKARAAQDIEFAKFAEDAEFQAIVK